MMDKDNERRLAQVADLAILLAEEIRDREAAMARAEPTRLDRAAAVRAAQVLGVPDIDGPRQQELLAREFASHRVDVSDVVKRMGNSKQGSDAGSAA